MNPNVSCTLLAGLSKLQRFGVYSFGKALIDSSVALISTDLVPASSVVRSTFRVKHLFERGFRECLPRGLLRVLALSIFTVSCLLFFRLLDRLDHRPQSFSLDPQYPLYPFCLNSAFHQRTCPHQALTHSHLSFESLL